MTNEPKKDPFGNYCVTVMPIELESRKKSKMIPEQRKSAAYKSDFPNSKATMRSINISLEDNEAIFS